MQELGKCVFVCEVYSSRHDKVVPESFPVKPVGKKSREKKTPSVFMRRSANRLKRFHEKKAAEQATLPKSPATEVIRAVRKEQESAWSIGVQRMVFFCFQCCCFTLQ